jgi:hypothetical protein
MRVLFLTGSPARQLPPPQLGDTQIVAGPDWPDAQTLAGEWISLRTPVGEYDFATLLAKIPDDQRPDVVFVFANGSWRNQPRNVGCFPGKRILLFSACHEKSAEVPQLFPYLGSERFDRVMLAKNHVHQEQFLAEAAAEFRTDNRHDVRWLPNRPRSLQARAI